MSQTTTLARLFAKRLAAVRVETSLTLRATDLALTLLPAWAICTRPAFRQKGHGKLLVQHLENILKTNDVKSLFIEVAVSNQAALALYASCGFEKAGARKNYYERGDGGREDALIMRKGL